MDEEIAGSSQSLANAAGHPKPIVVGVGASAGGVRALQNFFSALPENPGAAFVVVVHLDPQSPSDLSAILATRTKMPVLQVRDTEKLAANHVYVIAPGSRLRLTDTDISAAEFDEPRGQRAPIDLFFRSLAEQHGDGFAIILTGAGSDGTTGVKEVKESGGIILVQDPSEAEYPSMPRNAIATGLADFVLPVEDLAKNLVELIRNKDNVLPAGEPEFDEELVRRVLAHVRVRTGHDFLKYKRSTILRRLARRMQVTRIDDLGRYYEFLREDADEAQALVGDLLISVTTFFRDNEAFDVLKSNVIPRLFEIKDTTDTLRVWVPGCATGEEAYSLAILLLEELGRSHTRPTLQIFGTDLDARALTIAREGRYPATIETDVSEERLRRFFTRDGEYYHVKRELRDVIVFAVHDVLKDPPFSRIDLLSCRNVLIYLDRDVQHQLITTFHYALNPRGFLLLGSAETADTPPGFFRIIDRKARIYESTAVSGEKVPLLPRLLGTPTGISGVAARLAEQRGRTTVSEAALHRQVLENIAPPSILVDRAHRVVHLSDHAGRYLQPSGGTLSGDVVELTRRELRLELRAALHRAFESRQPTLSLPMLVQFNGAPHRVHLQVKPVNHDGEADPRNALIMFIEGEPVEEALGGTAEESVSDDRIRRLSDELQATQARLRTTLEESEAANEELRAANEELQSINEEYRSTSEELETSKEELQSINEELQTVNSELKSKLDVISRAHSDLQNLMAATDFGTLFLDPSLRIKRFTDPVTELFRITPSDEGRPVGDFAHRLDYPDLGADAQAVLSRLTPIKRDIRSHDDRWYEVRLAPYRTVDDKIDGIVITFVDITERRRTEETLRSREAELRQQNRLIELSRDPIFVWNYDDGIVRWNRGCEELYGYSRHEAIGQRVDELLQTRGENITFAEVRAKLQEAGHWSGELLHTSKGGDALIVDSRMQLEDFDQRRLVLESVRDVTDRKEWERHQHLLLRELNHRVKNTMAVVQAIVHQTMRRHRSGDFEAALDGRLSALAVAHDLLAQSGWHGADLGDLARRQLEPYGPPQSGRWTIEGEPFLLPADIAANFGLMLHELSTNAAKYGAFSQPGGKVHLSWVIEPRDGERALMLTWREEGGPRVTPPAQTGFGSALIDRAIPKATVRREYLPGGLVCTMVLPQGAARR
ncbi:MAG TPA: chemotaxis protein CheB [Methylocella sp.]|nr:chemotaxis protein CheB [Methylocella sp.]